jgi:glucokinase
VILAGDIGGTKTVLSLLARDTDGSLTCLQEQSYPSQQYPEFDDILTAFLPDGMTIKSACFGVAGPVVNQRCQTTNLPWLLDADTLKEKQYTTKMKHLK